MVEMATKLADFSLRCMQSRDCHELPTRTEGLAEAVRRDIVLDVLRPGTRLTEESLAERYGTSRTPVREVLRMLAREHLLVHRPRAGYAVAIVNLDEMDDLYAIRVAIEEQIANRIVRVDAAGPLLELQQIWSLPANGVLADVNMVFEDEKFHETLAQASGSSVLAGMLRNLNHRLHVLRVRDFIDPERVKRTFEQHSAIVRSLLDGDQRLARALLRAHIWQSYAFVRASVLR